jgi:hypothetical protein
MEAVVRGAFFRSLLNDDDLHTGPLLAALPPGLHQRSTLSRRCNPDTSITA